MNKPVAATDPEGLKTLENLANANSFNKWIYGAVGTYCSGNILEIGSGIGNLAQYLLQNNKQLTLTDLREEYCTILKKKFAGHPNLNAVRLLDISAPDFEENNLFIFNRFDTVIALNVVEHIKNDELVIYNCKKLLAKNGQLVLLVPAYQGLYNSLDSTLDHFRRYNKSSLTAIFLKQGMEITDTKYFNFAGIAGWWFTGKILNRKIIPAYQIKIFNKLIPLFKFMDKLIFYKAGLSVIVVGKRVN